MIDKDSLNWEVSVGVTYSSLMSAVALFFTGMLISQYKSFDQTIKVPLIFLIISTFSFIFAATIYSNAGTEITLDKLRVAQKYMIYAKNIMELLGLYLFILAVPLVIGAVTNDNFLRVVTITVAITGFTLYSNSKFSILQKELTIERKRFMALTIVVLSLALYYFQSQTELSALFSYSGVAIVMLLVLLLATYYFCKRSKQYKPTFFRAYQDSDANELSDIILANLARLKKGFNADAVSRIKASSTPQGVRALAKQQKLYIAEFNGKLVGVAALKHDQLSNVFTDPTMQRRGIGQMLIEYVEQQAAQNGLENIDCVTTAIDHDFYKKIGYADVKQVDSEALGTGMLMRKTLQSQ